MNGWKERQAIEVANDRQMKPLELGVEEAAMPRRSKTITRMALWGRERRRKLCLSYRKKEAIVKP